MDPEEPEQATVGKNSILSVEIDGVWVPMAKVVSSSLVLDQEPRDEKLEKKGERKRHDHKN